MGWLAITYCIWISKYIHILLSVSMPIHRTIAPLTLNLTQTVLQSLATSLLISWSTATLLCPKVWSAPHCPQNKAHHSQLSKSSPSMPFQRYHPLLISRNHSILQTPFHAIVRAAYPSWTPSLLSSHIKNLPSNCPHLEQRLSLPRSFQLTIIASSSENKCCQFAWHLPIIFLCPFLPLW